MNYLESLEIGGRITHTDIHSLSQRLRSDILPLFSLADAPISEQDRILLSNQNEFSLMLVDSWLTVTREDLNEDPSTLLSGKAVSERLNELVKELYFNSYLKGSESIKVGIVPAMFQSLTPGTFLTSLRDSGQREWSEIRAILPLLAKSESLSDFFISFLEIQEEEHQPKAKEVVEIFQTQLAADLLMRFDFSSREFSRYFLAGVSNDEQIVFLYDTYYWT